ncbi:MAG: class I SAM-dependent methyltransferase, partial [Oscillospiraceae bacterium]|nr:class I SAM-dependent methyltransferase [Oscillospiraceae bacterium]
MENKNLNEINTNEITKNAWDAYQEDYANLHIPDFEMWMKGHVGLDCYEPMISLIGDVKGLKVLDTCCSSDAWQSYSWHNLGAKVTACDIAPKAIEIVKKDVEIMGFDIECVVADMQKLEPIADGQFDIVFASYPIYVQDIFEACRNWHRVLKKGGRLLWWAEHPILLCLEEDDNGVHIVRDYNHPEPTYYEHWDGTCEEDYSGLPWVENFWRV